MAWPVGATLNMVSGALMVLLGLGLFAANPRKDWNRLFALVAGFWGVQSIAANAPRALTTAEAARLAGELSLAFLLPLYFFIVMFVAAFPRPRAPFGTSLPAVALLLVPAAAGIVLLFAAPDLLLAAVEPTASGRYTLVWGPAIPYVAAAPLFAALFYALFVMMRRLDEAESAIERKQIAFVLGALAVLVAYNVPSNLIAFGGATLGLLQTSEARPAEAVLLALVMLAGLALLAILSAKLLRRARGAGPERVEARAILSAIGVVVVVATVEALTLQEADLLGIVRMGSVALIVYAIARYQLFDIDLKVKQVTPLAAAVLVGLALALAAFTLLRRTTLSGGMSGVVAILAAAFAFLPMLRVANRLADRVAPAVSREGDHLYLRKLEVYRASVEGVVREGRDPRSDDGWLADQRTRLGLSERDHAVVVSLASVGAETPAAAPDLRPGGVVFGKYVLDSVLAEGGYGRVFLARDRILGRAVVIKELLARWRADPRVVRTFLQEARIAGGLNHPSIVTVYAVEQHGQDHYIVMEHVPGGNLEARMGTKVPLDEAIRVTREVLSALDAAHAQGVVHRDVKPANVLLGARGEAKLADFGIAQVESEAPQRTVSGLTTGSFHPGTLQYMSPEQARGMPLDARSDLYAVGALLYRMVAGKPHLAVAGVDEFTARRLIAEAPPPPPTGVPWLDEVLRKALSADPAGRYPSARAFLESLAVNRVVERG